MSALKIGEKFLKLLNFEENFTIHILMIFKLKHLVINKNLFFSHPLFPFLTCLLEKCELATCSPRHDKIGMAVCSAVSFKEDLADFIKLNATQNNFYTPNPELDEMVSFF